MVLLKAFVHPLVCGLSFSFCLIPTEQMDKVQAKARAWEAEFQRTCHPKKPVCIGCVWVMGEGEGGEGRREDQVFLSKLSALVLTESPVRVEPLTPVTTIPTETHGTCHVRRNKFHLLSRSNLLCVYFWYEVLEMCTEALSFSAASSVTDNLKRPVPEEGAFYTLNYFAHY